MKNQKARMTFSNNPLTGWRFCLFTRPFRAARKFLPSRSEPEKLACSEKYKLLRNHVPRVRSFYVRTKSRFKIVLLQCINYNEKQILCFWGRNLCKLKNIHLGKPPLISKKLFFWFVYTRLHSSRLVYVGVVICLHSSAFVYTRLVARLCF